MAVEPTGRPAKVTTLVDQRRTDSSAGLSRSSITSIDGLHIDTVSSCDPVAAQIIELGKRQSWGWAGAVLHVPGRHYTRRG